MFFMSSIYRYLCRSMLFTFSVFVAHNLTSTYGIERTFSKFHFSCTLSEFCEFMSPEPDYDYYNNIDEILFECPVINPKRPLRAGNFLMCKAGGLLMRTANTTFSPPTR